MLEPEVASMMTTSNTRLIQMRLDASMNEYVLEGRGYTVDQKLRRHSPFIRYTDWKELVKDCTMDNDSA